MAGQAELGRAQVAIRASMDDLDKDLSKAKGTLQNVLSGIASTAGGILSAQLVGQIGGAVKDMVTEAMPLEGIRSAFEGITGDADAMLASLREGSSGMVTDVDLMKSYNQAAQLVGESFANQLPDAMGYLGKVAASTGQDVGFMLDSLVKGVGRLSPMILDNLGIQVTLEQATAKAAEMFGVEAEQLDKAKVQAGMMAVVTEQLEANTAAMPDVAGTAATQMAQLGVTMENLKAQIGMALLPVLQSVLGPLGELAQTYGPQLASVFGQLAEMLGPLVGGAMEALIPLVMQLMDSLIPLAQTLMEQLMPAFSTILEAAVELAGVLLEALAPVFSTLLEALLPVVTELVDMLAPILVELIGGLLPPLMPLIEGLAQIFLRLAEALLPVVSTLLEQLTPILVELADTLIPPLTVVLLALADIFVQLIEAVLPIFTELLELIMPVVGELADLIAEGLSIALTALGGIVEEVGKGIDWFTEHVLAPVLEAFEKIKKAIDGVVQWLRTLKDQLDGLELPDWLTPGSPTPLELGLVGIGDQLRRVSGLMGGLNAQMSLEAVTAGGGRTWNGDVIINGAANPEATAAAVLRALRSRGMMTATALR